MNNRRPKKHKYKKELQEIAKVLGLEDKAILAGFEDEITKKGHFELANNAKRFVNGILALSEEEQLFRINRFKAIIEAQKAEEAAKTT